MRSGPGAHNTPSVIFPILTTPEIQLPKDTTPMFTNASLHPQIYTPIFTTPQNEKHPYLQHPKMRNTQIYKPKFTTPCLQPHIYNPIFTNPNLPTPYLQQSNHNSYTKGFHYFGLGKESPSAGVRILGTTFYMSRKSFLGCYFLGWV